MPYLPPFRPNRLDLPHFDRDALRRRDTAWWRRLLSEGGGGRLIPVIEGRLLVVRQAERAVLFTLDAAPAHFAAAGDRLAFLGRQGDTDWLAVELDQVPAGAEAAEALDLRAAALLLAEEEAGLGAFARALGWFHRRHRYCGVCGSLTRSAEAGHARVCTDDACAATVYPRNDPAVIVLIHDGGSRCLLGRSARFVPGMYSTLAGFVEAGESLESCLMREVREEAGVELAEITYRHSQPWPMPQSLMVGFHARAATFELDPDPEEMEDVRWFERDWIRDQVANPRPEEGAFRLSPKISIARRLIDEWLESA